VFLSACAPGRATQTTLQVWDFKYGEAAMGGAMRAIDREFERTHPGVKVEHRGLSDVDDDAVLAAAIAANAAPDVAMVHAGAEIRALEGRLFPVEEAVRGLELLPAALDACRDARGVLVAVPLTTQGFGWYYNKELFSAAGLDPEKPPRTWDSFLAACAALRAAGIKPIAWGNNPPHGSDWLRRSLAATFYSREELPRLFASPAFAADPRFVRITEMIRRLRDLEYLDTPGAFRDQLRDAPALFRSGEAALYLGLFSDIDNWKDFSDALGPEKVGFFGSIDHPEARYPGRAAVQGAGIAYAVLASSPHRELAAAYAAAYLDQTSAALLTEQVGALLPLASRAYPTLAYPALAEVLAARDGGSDDIEIHYPTLEIKRALMRYDELYFGTREISIRTYLSSLGTAVKAALEAAARAAQ